MTRWRMLAQWAWLSLAQPRHGRRSSLDGMMREGGANTQAYGGGTLAFPLIATYRLNGDTPVLT
jgi:hypothetical protein